MLFEECPPGHYGPACRSQCGHCFGSDACFHTNGSCPGICEDGYVEDKCSTRELDQFSLMQIYANPYLIKQFCIFLVIHVLPDIGFPRLCTSESLVR